MDELSDRVQNLPPELFDIIYNLTFTPDSDLHLIHSGYKPPALLQIDRASRSKFASLYYGECAVFSVWGQPRGRKWLASLPKTHLLLLRKIRCATASLERLTGKESVAKLGSIVRMWPLVKARIERDFGMKLEADKLYLRVPYGAVGQEKYIATADQLIDFHATLMERRRRGSF